MARICNPPGFQLFDKAEIEQSIAARFESQVAMHGQRLAVKHGRSALTYSELDRCANRIANTLLASCGPGGAPVALLLSQGPPMIAAILGLLKAGKAYVPLDSRQPNRLLATLLSDCGAQQVLVDTEHAVLARPLSPAGVSMLMIEPILAEGDDSPPGYQVEPDCPAYIYYTSGSTGRPKGVVDDQRNVLHNIRRYTNSLRISPSDRLSLIQSPAFSGAVSSLFSGLLNGACVFPVDLPHEGFGGLSRVIHEERLTMLHAVPSIFEQLLKSGDTFPSLRIIRLEGDQTFPRHVALFKAAMKPPCILVNGLGATETGLTRQYFVDHACELSGDVVPIGYATEDMTALLLASDGSLVPPGEVGEIAIRSRYLARGYWRDAELTAAAFAPCPDHPGERLYRTGDLGRFRPDGCLEYLGRADFRVKHHGLWIDLEQIQEALTAQPGVAQALVLCRKEAAPAKLVAYFVPDAWPAPTHHALRQRIAQRVPASSLPAAFVALREFPLDANGKIDRRALPLPDCRTADDVGATKAPRDDLESALTALWCQTLAQPAVGRGDDFFALGGDSLQALELALAIERKFGRGLPLSAVLDAPTVAGMASLLRGERPLGDLVPLQPHGSERPFVCVHGHDGEVLALQRLARHLGPDRPVYGLRLGESDWLGNEKVSVEAMAARHLATLRAAQIDGPFLLGGFCFGGLVALEMARRLQRSGEAVACLALIDSEAPVPFKRATPQRWLRHHGAALGRLPSGARRTYLYQRMRSGQAAALRRLRLLFGLPALRLYRSLGVTPPRALRQPSLQADLALRHYKPQMYRGHTVLFAPRHHYASRHDPFAAWHGILTEGLEIRAIDVEAEQLMHEPAVRELARGIGTVLRHAEKESTRAQGSLKKSIETGL